MKINFIIGIIMSVSFPVPLTTYAHGPASDKIPEVTAVAYSSSAVVASADEKTAWEKLKAPASVGYQDELEAVAPSLEGPPEEAGEQEPLPDPIEPVNRIFFTFNDRFYFWVMKPAAKAYNTVVPEWGRVRVRNAFYNAAMPIRFVSSLLQLRIRSAFFELGSFMVNSTWGLGGMFDIVKKSPDIHSNQDLGLTLGHYGVGEGFYLVWPFIGPSSLRDTIGLAGDSFLYPVNYITPLEDSIAVRGYEQLNNTSLKIGEYEDLKASALDPYISLRDAYKQYHRDKIKEW